MNEPSDALDQLDPNHPGDPSTSSTPDNGRSDLGVALVAQVGAFVASGVFGYLFLLDRATKTIKAGPWPLVLSFLPLWGVLVWAIVAVARRRGRSPFGDGPRFRVSDLAFVAAGALGQVVVGLAYFLVGRLLDADMSKLDDPAKEIIDTAGGRNVGFAALAVAIVVGAPLVEELFYRGVVWRAASDLCARSAGAVWRVAMPIAISGLWFGAIHFEALQFPALAAVGAMCAFLVSREGRLAPAVFFHMGFNLVTVIALGSKL